MGGGGGGGGEQENSVRITRAAKKRAAACSASDNPPANKKRVVLGELTNFRNVVASTRSDFVGSQKHKNRLKKKDKGKKIEESDRNSDDPQMCVPYALDIYDYLHSMEVCLF